MRNFLFVAPRYEAFGKYYPFPIGLGYVVSSVKQKGFNVFCLNLCHYAEPVEKLLSECIKDKQIDVLCIGAMSYNWNEVDEVLVAAKRIKPEIVTVVGGAIIIADPRFALENMQIDFGVIGEGEETMVELAGALCNGTDINKVNGLIFFDKHNNIITTKPRQVIADLDLLPFPDYEGLEFDKWVSTRWQEQSMGSVYFDISEKQRLCELITSRGCAFACTFCYHPLGHKYRQRSLDNVFKEIDYLVKKYDINVFNILDELFSLHEKRIYEFTKRIKQYNIRWMAQWRVDNVNKPILKAIKDSGVLHIGFGVESMSDTILQSMKKRITKAQVEQAYKLAIEEGVRAVGNIILGDPEETEQTIKESVDWWLKHPEREITMGFLLAVPDSPVYRYALAHNLIKDKLQFIKNKFPVINLTKISDKKFNKIKRKVNYYISTQKYRLEGKVLSTKRQSAVYNGKNIYNFKIECPVCQHISEYNYIQYSLKPYSTIICKHCYKRLKISTKKAFPQDYNAIKGFLFQHALVIYVTYLKKYSFFKNIANKLKRLL
ncbi:MAG: B12-binding domain-containing radical SAM protein [Planctomycetes bacterium]|nr:B12-binding domain-containing radical SAM protein [Planctomycetota bacterium]MBU1517385.1 B12-binding domain-containing radical SAM protein [Planctomycetota bacterium]MBU2596812.1 B12-binding domain-containing radical SAM protein [Planctomycetota bacterium]